MVCNCNVVKRNASEEFKTGTYLTVCASLVAWQVCIGGAADHVDDLQSCFRLLRSLIGGGSQSSNIESVDGRTRDEADFCHLLFLSGDTFESQIPIRGECGNSVDIKRVDLLPIYNDIFCPRQVELPHLISAAHFKKAASVA